MNCKEFKEAVLKTSGDEYDNKSLNQALLDHSHHCSKCASYLEDSQTLASALRNYSRAIGDASAHSSLEGKLLQAFRETRLDDQVRKSWTDRIRTIRSPSIGWAMSVGILILGIAIGYTFRNHFFPALVDPGHEGQIQKPLSDLASLPEDTNIPGKQVPAPLLLRRDDGTDGYYEFITGTDFIDLGGSFEPESWAGSQLLRINLPRTSLLMFGLPVNATLIEEEVLADVVIGQDGVIHAIRFIQTADFTEKY